MNLSDKSHEHGWTSVAKGKLGDGFSFHPSLQKWLLEFTHLKSDTELEVLEISCGEVSCPTAETLFVWEEPREPNNSDPVSALQSKDSKSDSIQKEFRISRKKEQISKMDIQLSWKKFESKGLS